MKRSVWVVGGVSLLMAAPVMGQTFTDRVVARLAEDGYRAVEVKNGPTETKVEAIRGDTRLEVVYDRSTGQIVEQEVEAFVGTAPPAGVIEISNRERDFSDLARGRVSDDDDEDDDDRDRHRGRGRDSNDDDGSGRDRGRDRGDDDGHSSGRGHGSGEDDGDRDDDLGPEEDDDHDHGEDNSGRGNASDRGDDDGDDGDDGEDGDDSDD